MPSKAPFEGASSLVLEPMRCRFFLFSAALGLLIAGRILAADRARPTPAPAPPVPPSAAQLRELAPVLDRALAAYNADDAKAFLAEMASSAPGIRQPGVYQRLFEEFYKVEFGSFVSKVIDPKESNPDRDWAVLVYRAKFTKQEAKLSANFARENGAVKLMQLRIEKIEPAK